MGTRTWLVLAALVGATGCSGLKTYPNEASKNVHVSTQVDPKVRAALHVHEVTGACTSRYQGTVALDRPALDIGIAAEQPTYLVVSFDTSSFMAGARPPHVGDLNHPPPRHEDELPVTLQQRTYNQGLPRKHTRARRLRRPPLP